MRDIYGEILENASHFLRRYRFSRLILLRPNAFRRTVFAVERDFRKLFLPNREIKLLKVVLETLKYAFFKIVLKNPVYPLLFQ